jgi:hypothetical protein
MRLILSSIATVAMFLAASAASAFVFEATPTAPGPYAVGDLVEVNISMRTDGEAIGSIGAIAYGYDTGVLAFVSGEAVGSATNTSILDLGPSGLLPQGGISNGAGAAGALNPGGVAAPVNRNIGAGDVIAPGVVEFFSGVQATLPTPVSSDANDLGIGGTVIADGGVSARLVFEVIGVGITEIQIGGDGNLGGVVLGDGTVLSGEGLNAVVPVVVPEPGTALLMGLGLAGLGLAGRRS